MDDGHSPVVGLNILRACLRDIIVSDFRAVATALLDGREHPAYCALRTLNTYCFGSLGEELKRWGQIHLGTDAINTCFGRVTAVDWHMGICRRALNDARDFGRIRQVVREQSKRKSRRKTKPDRPPLSEDEKIAAEFMVRVHGSAKEWRSGISRALDALGYIDELLVVVRQKTFVPTPTQKRILRTLRDKGPMKQVKLRSVLRVTSNETLFGKNGRGGLSELVKVGLVNSDRRIGYHLPPQTVAGKRTKGGL